ncbi:hypothetical protein AS034_03540 [[Bacillus] enclensis]|jgi:hypothetical protein|uniref:Uncharacterized protein n=1 Tax=[Bacillus] enclensis TaxID=1402860 RepID=A0A0V8HLM2_9BACI|nr:hypothetical protein [[Bacillus] enclensis]OAT83898.1 hypothetical protein A6P54_00940 [Bacillus sp. MKU004]QTC43189.1 hypothetical protein I7V34_08105 [Bacillus sp. V3]QWC21354.1 hypothetical protein KJK41_13555 [Bacillus haikouensis]KSU63338.1 hypothetical protein AS034_03540 [[Bacillus] enclensis]MBH9964656.1 hypothetical protein [[Bacillus] enclensis]
MNLYHIYRNEQHTLLYHGIMYLLIGVGMLLVVEELFYFPLLLFIPAMTNLYLSRSIKKEIRKSTRLFYEEIPVSSHSLIGVKTKEAFYYLKSNGWSSYSLQRTSLINSPKHYVFQRKDKLPLTLYKWSRRVIIANEKKNIEYRLKYHSLTAIEWVNEEDGETILLYKGNKRWVLNYKGKNRLSLQKGFLPQSFQRLFDSHHSHVTFFEAYSEADDWLLIFLWLVDSDYFLTS